MAEDEVAALLRCSVGHLDPHRFFAQHVDVPHSHRAELVVRVAVEVARRHVGIDDLAANRIEEQLHRAIVLEHLPVAALAGADGIVFSFLIDGGGDVLRDEFEDVDVALPVADGVVVRLHADHAPGLVAGLERDSDPVHRRRADGGDLAAIVQLLEHVRCGEERVPSAQNVCSEAVTDRKVNRLRIVLIDEVGEVDDAALRIDFGDVEVRRVHQLRDRLVNRGVEVVEVLRLAAELRDAEERRLQPLCALRFGDVAEVPRARGVLPLGGHRHRSASQDAAVFEVHRIVGAHFIRIRVEVVHEFDERIPIVDQIRGVAEQIVVIRACGYRLRDSPDLEKAAVVREDVAVVVDDQDAVDRRLLLRLEDSDGRTQRLPRHRPAGALEQPHQGAAGALNAGGSTVNGRLRIELRHAEMRRRGAILPVRLQSPGKP